MKSLELSIIRAEGLDYSKCFVYFDRIKFSNLNIKSQQQQVYLPIIGELGLELFLEGNKLGEVFISTLKLERDGLQWLPILNDGSESISELPDEVPLPRILISLCESKNKHPDRPMTEFEKLQDGRLKEKNENKESEKVEVSGTEDLERGQMGESKREGHSADWKINDEKQQFQKEFRLNQQSSDNRYWKTEFSLESFVGFRQINPSLRVTSEATFSIRVDKQDAKAQKQDLSAPSHEVINVSRVSINELHSQTLVLKTQLEYEKNISDQKSLIIESLQKNQKESKESFEEVFSSLSLEISKLTGKKCKNKKYKQELLIENKILKKKIQERELEGKQNAMIKEKSKFFEESLVESQKSNEKILEALKAMEDKFKTVECKKCFEKESINSKNSNKIIKLSQKIEILNEKLNIQEFQNQEHLINIQELKNKLNEAIQENTELKLEKLIKADPSEKISEKDDLDYKIESHYPEILSKGMKLSKGIFLFNGKKIKINENEKGLFLMHKEREVKYSDLKDTDAPRHEKNSFSMEDISNHIDSLKPTNLIFNRANLRESKLRVLTKQW